MHCPLALFFRAATVHPDPDRVVLQMSNLRICNALVRLFYNGKKAGSSRPRAEGEMRIKGSCLMDVRWPGELERTCQVLGIRI